MGRSWDFYDDIAHLYDGQYEEPYWKLYHEITARLIERAIQRFFPGKETLLVADIGTGTGTWMEFFLLEDHRVWALDPSEKMLQRARLKAELLEVGPDKVFFHHGIAEAMPYPDNFFDVVNAQGDVLSYAVEPDTVFQQVKRVLKPGGLLIGSVDNLFAFLNDFAATGNLREFDRTLNSHHCTIGDHKHSSTRFTSHLYNPDTLKKVAQKHQMLLVETAGKVVFGPYEEKAISHHFDQLATLECTFALHPSLMCRAEHLHFIMQKEGGK